MSTVHRPARSRSRLTVSFRAAAVAIGALIALAVTLLFVTLSGAGNTRVVRAAQPATPLQRLIQYHGTGQPPATAPGTAQAPRYTRTDHEHGLVP